MFDAHARRVAKAVELIGLTPAQNIRCDNVKTLSQRINVVAPGDFCRRAVLAAMKQNKIRPTASFEEMGLDVADQNRAVLITRHALERLKKSHAAVDGDGLAGHEIAQR